MTDLNWTEIFERCPELEPPGYEEASAAAKVKTAERYKLHGKKRAKGSNARKVVKESRQATNARTGKFPSLKHGAD